MTTVDRKTWLQRLIGKENADGIRKDAQEATSVLDSLGLARKEEMVEVVEEKPIAQALATAIVEAAGGDMTTLTVERLAEILATILPGEAEMSAEEIVEEEKPRPEEEELMKSLTRLSAYTTRQTEDMGALAQEVATLKGVMPKVSDIVSRLEAIEAVLSSRPRQASHDAGTILDQNGASMKELADKVKAGAEEYEIILGQRVKKAAAR